MSTNITFNATTYTIPAEGDSNWGTNVSNYLIAIASGALQKTGGAFTLTAEVDFGSSYGVKALYFKSRATNPASAGQVRLGNDEFIKWRNAANNADIGLKVNTSNALEFNGTVLGSNLATITGTRAAPQAIVAGTGVAFIGTAGENIWFIEGSGGAVNISANPQITAATTVGQKLKLIGRSATNTVQFDDGDGLSLNGTSILGENQILDLIFDGTNWVEISRSF